MADDLGAVRRTPRPTGDRQTPETVAQLPRGATNAPTPVSTDTGNATDDLSPEVEAALIEQHGPEIAAIADAFHELRGKLHATAVLGHLHTTDNDMQAFLELPDCQACGGTGKDDHGTPFEAPLAVHFAGPPVRAEGRRRQLCMWCGHVLVDVPAEAPLAPHLPWPAGSVVQIEDGYASQLPYPEGDALPPGCCALPDDGEPVCICSVESTPCPDCRDEDQADDEDEPTCPICKATELCDHCADDGWTHVGPKRTEDGPDEAQETRAAADWPAETVDTRYDEQEADRD